MNDVATHVTTLGMVRGVLTAVLFAAFIALWFWAWSSKRREDFAAIAALPLEDDATNLAQGDAR
ncbi:MAG TPA: cbb3-type cytochrome c oxidase subunit 3 [Steroidobacteraceae bacterium]|jgi:cytochrome c oxidase cbb3-type subunit 4|nr:cbb3-type cytochrome c oxidase subunit 3 [Steroidobacteraceae bacterium]